MSPKLCLFHAKTCKTSSENKEAIYHIECIWFYAFWIKKHFEWNFKMFSWMSQFICSLLHLTGWFVFIMRHVIRNKVPMKAAQLIAFSEPSQQSKSELQALAFPNHSRSWLHVFFYDIIQCTNARCAEGITTIAALHQEHALYEEKRECWESL